MFIGNDELEKIKNEELKTVIGEWWAMALWALHKLSGLCGWIGSWTKE